MREIKIPTCVVTVPVATVITAVLFTALVRNVFQQWIRLSGLRAPFTEWEAGAVFVLAVAALAVYLVLQLAWVFSGVPLSIFKWGDEYVERRDYALGATLMVAIVEGMVIGIGFPLLFIIETASLLLSLGLPRCPLFRRDLGELAYSAAMGAGVFLLSPMLFWREGMQVPALALCQLFGSGVVIMAVVFYNPGFFHLDHAEEVPRKGGEQAGAQRRPVRLRKKRRRRM